jgi:hypothetical protein
MKALWIIGTFLVCSPFLRAQNSPFPDLSDFTKSPTEHIIHQIDEPFRVRSVTGTIASEAGSDTPGMAGVLLEIEGPAQKRTIRHALSDSRGRFKISRVPEGSYRFKATLNGFQSVVGTIVVSKHAGKSAEIKIRLRLGV